MYYEGVIIEESLHDKNVLNLIEIISTKVEPVTKKHKTPWLKQWTLHTVKISEGNANNIAKAISKALEHNHWYIDFKNKNYHYVIFPSKVFKVDRSKPEQYKQVTYYGIS